MESMCILSFSSYPVPFCVQGPQICRPEVLIVNAKQSYSVFGPSGVRALTLAAGINVGGHNKGHIFLSPLLSLSFFLLPAHC